MVDPLHRSGSTSSIAANNRYKPLSDVDVDDDMSTTSTVSEPKTANTPAKRPRPIHILYKKYVDLKKEIGSLNGVSKETTFKFLMNNLVVRPGNLQEYKKNYRIP